MPKKIIGLFRIICCCRKKILFHQYVDRYLSLILFALYKHGKYIEEVSDKNTNAYVLLYMHSLRAIRQKKYLKGFF